MTAEEVRAALIARLEPLTVHVGSTPTRPPARWVSVYFGAGTIGPIRFSGSFAQQRIAVRAVCCGYGDADALAVADQVRDLWTGWRPLDHPAVGPVNEVDLDAPILRDGSGAANTRSSLTLLFRVTIPRLS